MRPSFTKIRCAKKPISSVQSIRSPLSRSPLKNILLGVSGKSPAFSCTSRLIEEGRFAIVTSVEAGSGGRAASQALRHRGADERSSRGRPSRVVLTPRRWCQVRDDASRIARMMVARKPGSPGRARSTPSNHCAGKAGYFWLTCGSAACVLVARGPWAQPVPGLPCALYSRRGLCC